jgi:hypothetical protein
MRVCILGGLRVWPPFYRLDRPNKKSGDWLGPWLESRVGWAMNSRELLEETHLQWENMVLPGARRRRQGTDDLSGRRQQF